MTRLNTCTMYQSRTLQIIKHENAMKPVEIMTCKKVRSEWNNANAHTKNRMTNKKRTEKKRGCVKKVRRGRSNTRALIWVTCVCVWVCARTFFNVFKSKCRRFFLCWCCCCLVHGGRIKISMCIQIEWMNKIHSGKKGSVHLWYINVSIRWFAVIIFHTYLCLWL